jgi:hypothetical protein
MNDFTIVLTSSVLAAGLTSFVNWWIQRNNYRNEYYKKIIEKRMAVYDSVNQVLSRLQIISISKGGKKSHGAFNQLDQYSDFMVRLAYASLEGLWLSSDFATLLTDFNAFLYSKFNLVSVADDINIEAIREIAEENYQEIAILKEGLRDQILKDLTTLHYVGDFLKTKS